MNVGGTRGRFARIVAGLFVCIAAGALSSIGVATSSGGTASAMYYTTGKKGHKVVICHVPPGNPDNAHTIEVSENAVDAHLAHGDTLGPCPTDPN